MLIINFHPDEKIENALKRYKNKHRKVKMMQTLRERKHFEKPSATKRKEELSAAYSLKFKNK